MDVLYCGDANMADGLMLSVLSLLSNVKEPLNVHVLTMCFETPEKCYKALPEDFVVFLDELVSSRNGGNVRLYNITEMFLEESPSSNVDTRFTPFCMLRLFADRLDLPDRILYLDTDVICNGDFSQFYDQDMTDIEIAGVLDYYGRWFFRRNIFKMDYLNSGVLMLNMEQIKRTGLFEKSREMCRTKKMFMPDQSAINKLAQNKKICERKYNDQRKQHDDTVFRHFTTSFRFFPWIHTVCVKPWDIERMHSVLRCHEYDELLNEYRVLRHRYNNRQEIAK